MRLSNLFLLDALGIEMKSIFSMNSIMTFMMVYDAKRNKLKIRAYIVRVQLLYKCIIFSSVGLFVFMIIYVCAEKKNNKK